MKLIYTDAQNLFDEDADEMIAFDLAPNDAQEIIRRVNAHDALIEALNKIASEPMPMIGDVETCKFILRRIDGIATAALALAEKGETS